jgi:hypothetical protein
MASRFESPVQRLAIVPTAAAALLAVLASSPPRCPMLGRVALARADSLKIEPPADVGAEVAQR